MFTMDTPSNYSPFPGGLAVCHLRISNHQIQIQIQIQFSWQSIIYVMRYLHCSCYVHFRVLHSPSTFCRVIFIDSMRPFHLPIRLDDLRFSTMLTASLNFVRVISPSTSTRGPLW